MLPSFEGAKEFRNDFYFGRRNERQKASFEIDSFGVMNWNMTCNYFDSLSKLFFLFFFSFFLMKG